MLQGSSKVASLLWQLLLVLGSDSPNSDQASRLMLRASEPGSLLRAHAGQFPDTTFCTRGLLNPFLVYRLSRLSLTTYGKSMTQIGQLASRIEYFIIKLTHSKYLLNDAKHPKLVLTGLSLEDQPKNLSGIDTTTPEGRRQP